MDKNRLTAVGIPPDPWITLRAFTNARIALGRTGTAIPLQHVLDFRMAHANARDAVHSALNVKELVKQFSALQLPVCSVSSRADNRKKYLLRPDTGKQLNEASRQKLLSLKSIASDVCFIVADGLSASAIHQHAFPVLKRLVSFTVSNGLSIAPLCIVEQARVAICDEVGSLLHAKIAIILIGERPGLSASDSMSAYITFNPKPGLTDEARNCVSNIRPNGMDYELSAEKIFYLLKESLQLQLSGVLLKDNLVTLNAIST